MSATDELLEKLRTLKYDYDSMSTSLEDAIGDIVYELEQAIAATLVRRTCQQEEHGWGTEGDHARVWLTCGHDCMVETVADLPNYCPKCGKEVVDA